MGQHKQDYVTSSATCGTLLLSIHKGLLCRDGLCCRASLDSSAVYPCLFRVLRNPADVVCLQDTYLATMCAELVLPMPGGPDSSTAFLPISLGLACRPQHSTNVATQGHLGYLATHTYAPRCTAGCTVQSTQVPVQIASATTALHTAATQLQNEKMSHSQGPVQYRTPASPPSSATLCRHRQTLPSTTHLVPSRPGLHRCSTPQVHVLPLVQPLAQRLHVALIAHQVLGGLGLVFLHPQRV
jgi:hypothetical protein